MSEITCNHCGGLLDEDINYCPGCQMPTPAQQDKDFAAVRKKFIIGMIGLTIFCLVMILWLPRVTP